VLLDEEPYETLVVLADLLRSVNNLEDANYSCESAIALVPNRAEAHASHSLVLASMERFGEALQAANRAVSLAPEYGIGWHAKALAERFLGDTIAAEQSYGMAIQHRPGWPLPVVERAMLRFQRGDFFGAVDDYEQRWMVDSALPRRHTLIEPWEGERFSGCLLVWSEQGLGDEIFFLGLLPLVLELHSCVVAEVDRRLVPLFSRSFPDVLFLEKGSACFSTLDIQRALPLASLLRVLVRSGIPLPVNLHQYLRIPEATARTRLMVNDSQLQASPVRIGICWKSFRPTMGSSKSIELELLTPLAEIPEVEIVSLQHGDCESEERAFREATGQPMLKFDFDPYQEIDLLAGQISSCDLIVSIAGVAAHLGGGLGVHTFVLSPSTRGRLWYWETKPPWYKSAKVYRADSRLDLPKTLHEMFHDISGMLPRMETKSGK
jgi:hypothetical protein